MELTKKYGNIFELDIMNQRFLIISEITTLKEILKSRPKQFRRDKSLLPPFEVLSLALESLFSSEGANWGRLRRLTSAPFNKQNVDCMNDSIVEEVLLLIKKIKKQENQVVDLGELTMHYTLQVIVRTSLSDKAMAQYFSDYHTLQADTHAIFDFIIYRAFFPLPEWCWRLSPYWKLQVKALEANNKLDTIINNIVLAEKEKLLTSSSSISASVSDEKLSFVQLLLRESLNLSASSVTAATTTHEPKLSDSELTANIKTFLLAGSETTSVTLTWCLYYLITNPHCLAKARDECASIFDSAGTGVGDSGTCELDYAWVKKLSSEHNNRSKSVRDSLLYCSCCFKEALRISGPAPFSGVDLVGDTPLTLSNGLIVYPNDRVLCYQEGVMYDESVFPSPETFNPARWIDSDASALERMNYHFTAFGSGPRLCPGMSLAISEGVLALVAMISLFDFELQCEPADVQRVMGFTARPKSVPIKFTSRVVLH